MGLGIVAIVLDMRHVHLPTTYTRLLYLLREVLTLGSTAELCLVVTKHAVKPFTAWFLLGISPQLRRLTDCREMYGLFEVDCEILSLVSCC